MQRLFMVLGLGLLANTVGADCQSIEQQVVESYLGSTTNSINEQLYQKLCQQTLSSTKTEQALVFDNLGLKGDTQSLAQACVTHNLDYFQKHQQQILLSYTHNPAWQQCLGQLSVTATQVANNNTVQLYAASSPKADNVESVTWTPRDALECDGIMHGDLLLFFSGTRINDQGVTMTCQRKQNVDITITLNTRRHGTETRILPRTPLVKFHHYVWSYRTDDFNKRYYQCYNDFNELAGNFESCTQVNDCKNPAEVVAWCSEKYGKSYFSVDHVRIK